MLSAAAYVLLSTTAWRDPVNVGKLLVVPDTAITDTKKKTHKRMWKASKDLQYNFNNAQTALKTMFKHIIKPAYHLAGMGQTGFATDKDPAILQGIQTLYRKPSLGKLDAALL